MREKDLKHVISQLSEGDKDKLLSKLISDDKNLELFLSETEGKVELDISKKAKEDIEKAFERAIEAFDSYDDEDYGFIDYGRGAWDERYVNLDGEDVEDYLESVKEEIYPLRDTLRKYSDVEIPKALIKEIYDWALEGPSNFFSDNVSSDAFDDLFIDILISTIRSKEDALALAEDLSEKVDSYASKNAVERIYREYGFIDKEIEHRIAQCRDDKTLLGIIDRLNLLGRIKEGVDLARKWYLDNGSHCRNTELGEYVLNSYKNDEKGLEDYIDVGGFQPNMYEKLFFHFKERGNYKRKKYYLLALAIRSYEKEMWFEMLEKELSKEDYLEERKKLLEHYKEYDIELYAKILLKEGDYSTVMKYLKEGKINDSNGYTFSIALSEYYPEEIYSMWLSDARGSVELESLRSDYDNAIKALYRLRSLATSMGALDRYKKDLEAIIEDNKSRKKFSTRVKKEGLLDI